jgi:K+-sensing histidine kinase KdpD
MPPGEDSDDRLVALVHGLRTPLAIVSGFAELLTKKDESLTPEQRREYVARIAAATDEMRELLDAQRASG